MLGLIMPLSAQKSYPLQSPSGTLTAEIVVGDELTFSLKQGETKVLSPSPISLLLQTGEELGKQAKVSKVTRVMVDKEIASPFYKKATITDIYNELTIAFKGNYSVVFRMYDEGLAYRFVTKRNGQLTIANEQAAYRFPQDFMTWSPYVNTTAESFEEQYFNSFEQPYNHQTITSLNEKRLMILPLLVDLNDGKKLCITEADLEDYPGMFLNNQKEQPLLKGHFAPYPKTKQQGGHNNLQMLVTEREQYIAKTNGNRSFPWRIFIVTTEDKQLTDCDMVYKLSSPSRIADSSWIKPGKVAWEWWNDWNLYGVDFATGVNNETYQYYIDFAAKKGIEYVILDEGWSVNMTADLLQVVPEIDLEGLIAYAEERGVGIILWAGYWALDRDMEKVVRHYSEMGVKGFKIDFMDRDDQEMIQFLYRAAEVCAKHQMLVDFHGVCKPTGLQRTWPNVVNYEGVNGLEQMKWAAASLDQVSYDVTIPFIRMVAGPMDYTQGAMRNAAHGCYQPIYSEPMSQGTRCRQLAMYVVFEAPLNMLCDSPSNYLREPVCTDFIAQIPTDWDETVAINGEVGEFITIARRKGNEWYIGGMTNRTERTLTLDLSFLGEGDYRIELFRDGMNANRAGSDFLHETAPLRLDRKLIVKLAPGGGFAARIFAN